MMCSGFTVASYYTTCYEKVWCRGEAVVEHNGLDTACKITMISVDGSFKRHSACCTRISRAMAPPGPLTARMPMA
eukprot:1256000-Amphidinium_carterae.1